MDDNNQPQRPRLKHGGRRKRSAFNPEARPQLHGQTERSLQQVETTRHEFNRAKRQRRAKEKYGEAYLGFEKAEEKKQEELHAARLQRTQERGAAARTDSIPFECALENIRAQFPKYHKTMTKADLLARVFKHMPQLVVRAMWYNEVDLRHTFHTHGRLGSIVARANAAWPRIALAQGCADQIWPKLLFPYALACYERQYTPHRFFDRDAFLELWQRTPESQDLLPFPSRVANKLNATLANIAHAGDACDILAETSTKAWVGDLMSALKGIEQGPTDEEIILPDLDTLSIQEPAEDGDVLMQSVETERYVYKETAHQQTQPEATRRAHHAEWVSATIQHIRNDVRELKLEQIATGVDQAAALDKRIRNLKEEVHMLLDVQLLRAECKKLGFSQFA